MIAFGNDASNPFRYSSAASRGLYLNGTLLENAVIGNTATSIKAYAFYNNNTLKTISLPSTITSIGNYAFSYMTGLTGDIVIPDSVTSIGSFNFVQIRGVTNITIGSGVTSVGCSVFADTSASNFPGNGTGTLYIKRNLVQDSGRNGGLRFKRLVVGGDLTQGTLNSCRYSGSFLEQIRVGGNYNNTATGNANLYYSSKGTVNLAFVEIMGTISNTNGTLFLDASTGLKNGTILHLGYDVVANGAFPCVPSKIPASSSRISMIYVGDGSSAAHDNAILQQYLGDTGGWADYSSKLDTWYNYINDPDANPDYIS